MDPEQSARETKNTEPTFTIPGHEESVDYLSWLPSDKIVTGSEDRTLRIWDLETSMQEGDSMEYEKYLGRAVTLTTRDGLIISSLDFEHILTHNAATRELVDDTWEPDSVEYGVLSCVALSPDERLLACCHKKRIVIWERAATTQVRGYIHSVYLDEHDAAKMACFSLDGAYLAVLSRNGGLVVLEMENFGYQCVFGPSTTREKSNSYDAIIWSPDGARLFCACRDNFIRVWDYRTNDIIGEPWAGHSRPVNCLCLSPDGKWLASGSPDTTVRFWEVESYRPFGEPLYHGTMVRAIAFSHSGEFLACSGGGSGNISIWRVPWWNGSDLKAFHPLLDISAVVSKNGPSSIPRGLDDDFFNMSLPRRPLGRSEENASQDPPQVQRPVGSSKWFKRLPRLTQARPHPVTMGYAQARTYVASQDSLNSNSYSPSRLGPPSPRNYPNVQVTVAMPHSEENSEEDAAHTPTEVSGVGCCGLLSPRKTRVPPKRRAVPLKPTKTSKPTTRPLRSSSLPVPAQTSPAPQDILELPAVVR